MTPASVLHLSAQTSQTELNAWLLNNRLPMAMELGDGSFQQVMNAATRPLVVITTVPAAGEEREWLIKKVRSVAQKWHHRSEGDRRPIERSVVFTWMDVDRWSKWLKNMYGLKQSGDVVIADHDVRVFALLIWHVLKSRVRNCCTMTRSPMGTR